MSGDVEVYNERAVPVSVSPVVGGYADPTERLVAWARGADAAGKLAAALCESALAPAMFKNDKKNVAATIMYGASLGMDPITSMQSIFVVHGKPGLYAQAMVALVQRAGHEVWTEDSTDSSVTVAGRRRGSEHEVKSTWTIDRAQKAGYLSNPKYKSDPQAMLYARAASEVCRRIAADALAGLYAVEELELAHSEPETVQIRRRKQPRAVKAKKSEPEPVDVAVEEPEPEVEGEQK